MQKIVECPGCKKKLQVGNPNNVEIRIIHCPNCKTPLKVKFFPQQEPLEARTCLPPRQQPANNGATQLVSGNDGATQLTSGRGGTTQLASLPKAQTSAKLMFGGVSYYLKEGQNIVGRKASSSQATVQIETADRYMSRQHCSITVTTLPDGSKKAVLSNYQNKNLTTIDGQEIGNSDAIRLTDGNNITMGHTTVSFKLS